MLCIAILQRYYSTANRHLGYSGVGKGQSAARDNVPKPREGTFQKSLRLPESLAGLIGEGLSLVMKSIKTRRGGCFFKTQISVKDNKTYKAIGN